MNKTFLFFILLFITTFTSWGQSTSEKENVITGIILDFETKEPIPFSNIFIIELGKGTISATNGTFTINAKNTQNLTLQISSLGYATERMQITDKQNHYKINLSPQSIELDGYTVTAKYKENDGGDAVVNQEVLEYIQPTSLQDIFALLPGGIAGSNNIHQRKTISSRQAGSDNNTAFGMGVSMDGVPMHNDGVRIQMAGYTGVSSLDPNDNVSVNTGVDMRTISTDHIESVTITKGIASAKEGNLSSGSIKVNSKKGKSPLKIRTKIDPLNTLIYAGKGFLLSEELGTLHIGIDATKSISDLRNTKSAYNRVTSQANYNNKLTLFGQQTDFNLKANLTTSFNDTKKDEQIAAMGERYKTNYQRYTLSSKLFMTLNHKLIDDLEFNLSADYSEDKLYHEKNVKNVSVLCIQTSKEEGEHEGEYLPQQYFTKYEIKNKPLNIFTSLNVNKYKQISTHSNYSMLLGSSLNYSKNFGKGAIVDPYRPPAPDNSFIRGRPNNEIPALVNWASYLESKLRLKFNNNEIHTTVGIRGTHMFNLPDNYDLHKQILIEPRMKFAYTVRNKIHDHTLSNTFRLGYGIENKLPSLDYLYPSKIYQDFIVLNAYFMEKDKRLLLTNTRIYNPVNPKLQANKNRKMEIGWDIRYNKLSFSLSAFYEKMTGGLQYFKEYYPLSYTYYNELKHPVNSKPTKNDFNSYLRKDFATNKRPNNSSKTIKKGIEYRCHFSDIKCIKSSVEINGAYYHTLYTTGVPVMYRPSITQNNKPYPYVGYYNGFKKIYRDRLNTNVWIHTHLPLLKLIFSNMVQFTWLESSQLGKDINVYPTTYLDLDGNMHQVKPEEIESNPELITLKRTFSESVFNKVEKPVRMIMDLKLTKEFNDHLKISFFANNIFQISPYYESKFLSKQRDWHQPFFGSEITFSL